MVGRGSGVAALAVEHLFGVSEVLGSIPGTDNSGSSCCFQTECLVIHSGLEVSV